MSVKTVFINQSEAGRVAATLRWQLGYDVEPSDCTGYVLNLVNRLEPAGGKSTEIIELAIQDTLEDDHTGQGWESTRGLRRMLGLPLEPEEDQDYIRSLESEVGY